MEDYYKRHAMESVFFIEAMNGWTKHTNLFQEVLGI